MKYNKFLYFSLLLQKIFILSESNTDVCPRESPLLIKNSTTDECVYEKYDETKHEISNKIIQTQWLNKINILGVFSTWYIGTDLSSTNDLIIQSFVYDHDIIYPTRYFYGIKANGRSLFYIQEENKFTNQIAINSTTTYKKFESVFIRIKLVNDDKKDYYLSSCFNNYTIELIDFYNNKVIGVPQDNLFGDALCISLIYTILELKREEKTYMFCFISDNKTGFYLYFQKFKFKNVDLAQENSYEKISFSQFTDEFKVHTSTTISCIEIIKYNIIQCFYMNTSNYLTVGLFGEEMLDFIYSEIIDNTTISASETEKVDIYYQSIHLKNEISIFGYILDKNNHECIYIQIKEIIYNKYYSKYEIEDYLIKYKKIEVKLEGKIYFDTFYYLSDLKKLNDNKFSLISTSQNQNPYQLYIIIFEFYNFHDTNLFIRYYNVPVIFYNFYIYRYIKSINFNGFLGLVYTITILKTDHRYQHFSIFNYINGTDSDLISLEENIILNLSDYINYNSLENNIFGLDLYGIKIINLPKTKDIGIYYFSKLKNNIIFENDILSPDDEIYFVYDYEVLEADHKIYTIEMAGVGYEKDYSGSLDYIIHTEILGNSSPESFYKQKIFIGRTTFYNFTLTNIISGINDNTCEDNCKVCYNGVCIKCLDNYKLIEDSNYNYCLTGTEEGFYYNEDYGIYKKCHEYCKSCLEGPIYQEDSLEIGDTNCNKCIDNYYKIENTNNCINKNNIPETYYFDTNKNLICKCFENCKTCNQNQTNSSYYSCLSCDENSILYEKSANCLNCKLKGKYANHYENECIDFIPEGYFLEDEENKAIAKCYFSCKNCSEKGDSNDHKCIACGEDYLYQNKNGKKCLKNCSEEYKYTDLDTKRCYNDCIDNIISERIYNYKNICASLEQKPDNYEVINNAFVRICNNLTDYYFNNECYEVCPENTKINESEIDKRLCICKNLYYLDINSSQICIIGNNCPNEYPYLYKSECLSFCPNGTYISQNENNIKKCVDEKIEFDFSKMLNEIGKLNLYNNIVINDNPNTTINIYINGVYIDDIINIYSNLTFINLDECGNEIKRFYHLDSNENLYIVTYENLNDIENRVTNQFTFEIYLKNGTELEYLSVCKNLSISVSSAISKLDKVNYETAQIFYSQGYNIYNLSSEFYKDKCSPAHINGNDIILKDREEDFFPYNVSFCSNGCDLNNVEIETKRVSCSCNISYYEQENYIEYKYTKLTANDNFFIYLIDNLNYKIFECYKIIFKTPFLKIVKNLGFLFGVGIMLFFIVCYFIFLFYVLPKIRIQIYRLLPTKKKLIDKLKGEKRKNLIYTKRQENITKDNSKSKTNIKFKKETKKNTILSLRKNSQKKTTKMKSNTSKLNAPFRRKSEYLSEDKILCHKTENIDQIKKREDLEINCLPYSLALQLDKRNIFSMFINFIKMKIDIISIFLYPEEFSYKSISLSIYLLDFLYSFFLNAFLYTDDIISEKYHNNGRLSFYTTIFLSLISNVVSFIIIYYIKKIVSYNEFLSLMVKDIKRINEFILTFKKMYLLLKIKVITFFIISFLSSIFITFYLFVFCQLYERSQGSLIINYLMGLIESFAYSVGISLIICILRLIGIRFKIIYLYRTSVYIDNKF